LAGYVMATSSFFKRIIGDFVRPSRPAGRPGRKAREALTLCESLLSERGEVSGATLAREVLSECQQLPDAAWAPFFDLLAANFSPRPEEIRAAAEAWLRESTADNLIRLERAVEPPRQELFRRLNMGPGGTAALIAMRARVLAGLKSHTEWMSIDADLAHLLGSWFNRGFLTLQRIDWHTPAIVLEKLIAHEAVHEIRGWDDLRRRLESDRRCFAFFHPVLPDEPLIFIEVALTKGMSATVRALLDPKAAVEDPARADTAIFYSITNCQEGLRGISFGNLLIKQVAEEIGRQLPRVQRYATLSPIPGFRAWLSDARTRIAALAGGAALLAELDRLDAPGWYRNAQDAVALKTLLMQLAASYLLETARDGEPADAVARFHLRNGARIERLNWLADDSEQGMRRSAGLMVNYVYDLDQVEKNHEAYVKDGQVAASHELRALVRACPLSRQPA
jgi:malonyl-CoA decarboxylase